MADSKTESKPKLQYVLMSGKHGRRDPNDPTGQTSIVYRPGDIVPDLTDQELAAFGDKFLTVAQFKARAAGLEEAQQAEVERDRAKIEREAEERTKTFVERDEEAEARAEQIAQMRAAGPQTEFNG